MRRFKAALGRPIAGGAPTVTLNLANLGQVYPDRLNTVDMRFTKILRFGRTRTNVGVDLYNLFNANTGTSFKRELRHRRLDVAASERDPEPALRALQRDGGFLVGCLVGLTFAGGGPQLTLDREQ